MPYDIQGKNLKEDYFKGLKQHKSRKNHTTAKKALPPKKTLPLYNNRKIINQQREERLTNK